MTTQEPHWLLEVMPRTRMNPSDETGYVSDIETDGDMRLRLTRDPHKAIKFASREAAQVILDDGAFLHAWGRDHGIQSMEHMFITEDASGEGRIEETK